MTLDRGSRYRYEIEHKGKKYLVDATRCAAEPDVGIIADYSDDHILLDPETEQRLKDDEKTMTDRDWDEIAMKFDAAMYGG